MITRFLHRKRVRLFTQMEEVTAAIHRHYLEPEMVVVSIAAIIVILAQRVVYVAH